MDSHKTRHYQSKISKDLKKIIKENLTILDSKVKNKFKKNTFIKNSNVNVIKEINEKKLNKLWLTSFNKVI